MAPNSSMTAYEKLSVLADNLWWSWQPEAKSIFRDIAPARFRKLNNNPKLLLQEYTPEELEVRLRELVIHSRINLAYRHFKQYLESDDTWGATHAGILGYRPIAYFSAEFGLHESLRVYSGGLGVLAGDHLKSASDLGVPLVGLGLFYHEGYFSQSLNEDGWQQEAYTTVDDTTVPVAPALDTDGNPAKITVETRTGQIHARVLKINVGRIKLYLLDSNIPENSEEDRKLTARLYGGDQRTRIRQEVLLGIGGVKALAAVGIHPRVVHMNEGHSAFAPLEIIRMRMHTDGMTFDDALRETRRMCVFTTHTPVPAGHDRFDSELTQEHLGAISDSLGLNHDGLMGLGRVDPQNHTEPFCMTVLAFKTSRRANAVSNLHGIVSRRMWAGLWPWRSEEEIPIGHITNGVHVPSWLASQIRVLYDRVLPENWHLHTGEPQVWANFESVNPGELWETHQALKSRLINFSRRLLTKQAEARNAPAAEIEELSHVLDPQALTIGFARRFAPYKRGDLFMWDVDRITKLMTDAERPIQFIFSGKAHPADDNGKALLQRIVRLSKEAPFKGKIVVLEDYDINIAREMVQGVDVWLNNPRRPLEASGTSGQKVVLNGGLNFSVLDGWWAEAFDGKNGFAIGNGETHVNQEIQDQRDAEDLMNVLESQVIPKFYDRDRDDLPQEWISMMKRAVRTLGWRFNADRMVMDYVTMSYVPAAGGLSAEMVVIP